MKIILVGQGPNQTSWKKSLEQAHDQKFKGAEAKRYAERQCAHLAVMGTVGELLARLLAIRPLTLYLATVRVNLNARWHGKSGKGDRFDPREGKAEAEELLRRNPNAKFVLLGRNVGECFNAPRGIVLTPWDQGFRQLMVVPHPSGINRWWNAPFNEALAQACLRMFLPELLRVAPRSPLDKPNGTT